MAQEQKTEIELSEREREYLSRLESEFRNLEEIAAQFTSSSKNPPKLKGIDIAGYSIPYNLGALGGDLLHYVDFKRTYNLDARIALAKTLPGKEKVVETLLLTKNRAGILLADVSGHMRTDSALVLALQMAFTTGVLNELDEYGEITTKLFENLNRSFYTQREGEKFLTLIYGEISESGKFRFLSAGHPYPIVFSNKHNRIVEISEDRLINFPMIGTMPSESDVDKPSEGETERKWKTPLGYKRRYTVNELNLMGSGDILVLYTDGLSEHRRESQDYFPKKLEEVLRRSKDRSARDIAEFIGEDVMHFNSTEDDVSYVIIKRG